MVPVAVTDAVVLRSRPYGEADKIVTFLTADAGKLTGIGKGARNSRRRFANCLEPFARVRLHYRARPGASLVFLERCDLVRPAGELVEPRRFAYGSYLLELIDRLTVEGQPVRELFALLCEGLEVLRAGAATAGFLRGFELHVLRHSGYDPDLAACTRCRRDLRPAARVFVDPRGHGLLCEGCRAAAAATVALSGTTLATLCALQAAPLAACQGRPLPAPAAHEAAQVLGALLAPHLQRPLRSLQLITALAS